MHTPGLRQERLFRITRSLVTSYFKDSFTRGLGDPSLAGVDAVRRGRCLASRAGFWGVFWSVLGRA